MKKEIRRIEYSPSVTDESRTVYGKEQFIREQLHKNFSITLMYLQE